MESARYDVCSVCLEAVCAGRGRAILKCRHVFHLDCIGSAFNANRGSMQCPNCRATEHGTWLLFSRHRHQRQEEDDTALNASFVAPGVEYMQPYVDGFCVPCICGCGRFEFVPLYFYGQHGRRS